MCGSREGDDYQRKVVALVGRVIRVMEDDLVAIERDLLDGLAGIFAVNGNSLCVVAPCHQGA